MHVFLQNVDDIIVTISKHIIYDPLIYVVNDDIYSISTLTTFF